MTPHDALKTGTRLLSRLGLLRDPLVAWMERRWRMIPDAAGSSVWKGHWADWPVRLWTGGGTDPYRTRHDRYRLAFGALAGGPEFRFHRSARDGMTPWPGGPGESYGAPAGFYPATIWIGGGFEMECPLDPDDPALDRIAEVSAIVQRVSGAVTAVAFAPGAVRLEVAASRATEQSLAHDAAIAMELLHLHPIARFR